MDRLSDLERLTIERACERLVLDALACNDRQDYAGMAALFAADGVLHRPGGEPLVGPAAIRAAYEARPKGRITRHVCSNVRVTVEAEDRARGACYVVVYAGSAEQAAEGHLGVAADPRRLVGEFDDEFVRTPDGWRFAVRRARFVLHT